MAHGSAIWLPFVQPFATVFLGIGAFALAYRQWLTANEKLKLDLYDKRDSALDNVNRELNEIIQHGRQHRAGLATLHFALGRFMTLFDGETAAIAKYIQASVFILLTKRDILEFEEKIEDALNLINSHSTLLHDSALRDMKVIVPPHPFDRFLAWLRA